MEQLGITYFDLALLILCPIGGVMGSFAFAIMDSIDPLNSPKDEANVSLASAQLQEKRGIWLGLRCTLGFILGLVVSLYFLGSILPNIATVAKIVALSIVAGYAAPKIWAAHGIIVEAKIKQLATENEKS
ncbi:hypothetical protein NQO50_004255 [Vibrio vulnificus]|uniref:hypothetical protein n=1 Tax=Vibrio TaxID=662 RepID=UPI00111FD9FC|nr:MULTISPECIES: hypothetical protein [Vibrio]EHU5198804.1 hypothetical protein [Vibrio vulnificus]EIN6343209.1 hypothetical protein [Vibrio parahaemolyticus]EIU7748412.1 hypothetical protein [Vibrio vulnificus]EJN6717876.1 hypothetical protein [Vibrio vulnificus]EJQ9994185.1 hypothetical protein [Vibrio vulnificus]